MLAVSVDTPEENRKTKADQALPFEILSDAAREVITLYALKHEGGGANGATIAVPTHLLVDRDGRVAWSFRAERIQDRPHPEEDLNAIRSLQPG